MWLFLAFSHLKNNNTMSSFFDFIMNFLEINVIIRKNRKRSKKL
mgnify:CR=1 FL=1